MPFRPRPERFQEIAPGCYRLGRPWTRRCGLFSFQATRSAQHPRALAMDVPASEESLAQGVAGLDVKY
jgi:hypothetical protein